MVFSIFISVFWFLSALADYSELVYYWQLKEYRLDRFNDFLASRLGKNFVWSYKVMFRPLIFISLILNPLIGFNLASALAAAFFIDLAFSLTKLVRRRFNRPKPTLKAALIIIVSLLAEAAILIISILSANLYLALPAASRFMLAALAVYLINLPAGMVKKIYLKHAAKKLSGFKKLTVIGVTGSYGKTTVKNFLRQMLSLKYQVVMPPKNVNTELGIAKFILQTDFNGADIFVVEMAAYRIGEIKLICDMVKPKIGILTAINEQHLPLFGSLKNTQTAKYELLRSLPAGGLAIVNADNQYARELVNTLKVKIKTFGQLKQFAPDLLISNLKIADNKLEFNANLDNEKLIDNYEIKTNLLGEYNAMNVAPVIIAAEYLGLAKAEITKQALRLSLPEATMQLISYGQAIIIDDSYNANPESFSVALKYLFGLKTVGQKIVITRGMLELGNASRAAHETAGRLIGQTADELIIISPDSADDLQRGAGNTGLKIKTIYEPKKLLEYLKQNKDKPNAILLEGRMPEIIKQEIKL